MEIELGRVLDAIRKYWKQGLSTAVVVVIIALVVAQTRPTTYTATTSLIAVPTEGAVVDDSVQTYLTLAESGPALDRVNLELGLDFSREELDRKITVAVIPGTQMIEISVTDADPQVAADISNASARALVAQVDQLTTGRLQNTLDSRLFESEILKNRLIGVDEQLRELQQDREDLTTEEQIIVDDLGAQRLEIARTKVDVDNSIRGIRTQLTLLQPPVVVNDFAQPPEVSNNLSPILTGIVGAVLGSFAGMGLMLFLELRRKSIRDARHLELQIDAPVLGSVSLKRKKSSTSFVNAAAARIAGRAKQAELQAIAILAPREESAMLDLSSALRDQMGAYEFPVTEHIGVLDGSIDLRSLNGVNGAILIVCQDRTSEEDATEVATLLRDLGILLIGSVLAVP